MKKRIGIIAIIVAVCLFIAAGICFFIYKSEMDKYEQDEKAVQAIADKIIDDEPVPTISNDTYKKSYVNADAVSNDVSDNVSDDMQYDNDGAQYYSDDDGDYLYDPDYYLKRHIDFDYLQSINKDATRWLTIPGTNVDYYVMQEPVVGESYYLWRNIYGNSSSWGSLLSPAIPGGGDSAHTLIFGHHMIDGSVAFSSFSNYYYSDAYNANAYRDVYVYYPDHSERWKVWAACDGYSSDGVYNIPSDLGSNSYVDLIQSMKSKARYKLGSAPDSNTKTLVMSTCNGWYAGSNVRFYVVCKPDVGYNYTDKKVFTIK